MKLPKFAWTTIGLAWIGICIWAFWSGSGKALVGVAASAVAAIFSVSSTAFAVNFFALSGVRGPNAARLAIVFWVMKLPVLGLALYLAMLAPWPHVGPSISSLALVYFAVAIGASRAISETPPPPDDDVRDS